MTVEVGVIGTGTIGADHVERLTARVVGTRVTAVFDVATERAQRVAAGAGATAHARGKRSSPRTPWTPWCRLARPPAPGPDDRLHRGGQAGPVREAARDVVHRGDAGARGGGSAGRRLVQLGFMRRYDAGYLDVKKAMADGIIGEPLLAHAVHRNATVPDFFRGEMSLTDSLVHEFDIFRWLFGAEIASVTVLPVKTSPLAADGMRDPQVAVLRMAGGEVVTVESFVNCQYGYDVRCEVVGSLGTVSLDNPRTTVVITAGRRSEGVPADWQERFAPAYTRELQTWVDGLAAGVVGGPSTWDGYAATAVAEAAVVSYAKGEPVDVVLADKPALY